MKRLLGLLVFLVACTGPQGPVGPQGGKGTKGDPGADGQDAFQFQTLDADGDALGPTSLYLNNTSYFYLEEFDLWAAWNVYGVSSSYALYNWIDCQGRMTFDTWAVDQNMAVLFLGKPYKMDYAWENWIFSIGFEDPFTGELVCQNLTNSDGSQAFFVTYTWEVAELVPEFGPITFPLQVVPVD